MHLSYATDMENNNIGNNIVQRDEQIPVDYCRTKIHHEQIQPTVDLVIELTSLSRHFHSVWSKDVWYSVHIATLDFHRSQFIVESG